MAEANVSSEDEPQTFDYRKLNFTCGTVLQDNAESEIKDLNGDVRHRAYNILPNNNVCDDVSNCYIDGECTNSSQNESSFTPSTSSLSGESPSQESSQDNLVYADRPPGKRIKSKSKRNSQLLLDQPFQPSPTSETPKSNDSTSSDMFVQLNSVDLNNGAIKKSSDKVTKPRSRKKLGVGAPRGRPRKAFVAMYHSQISGDKDTIKIRIKKSNLTAQTQLPANKKKSGRRKKHKTVSDTDASDHEITKKRVKFNVSSEVDLISPMEPLVQSVWGERIPQNVLQHIFQILCAQEGCLSLFRLCRVCRLWRDVALIPSLWRNIDLYWVKEKLRTDIKLHWLMQNRLSSCQDLNLGDWKVRDIHSALVALSKCCPELRGLNISSWKGLNADHLRLLITECGKLERLDISSINNASILNAQPLVGLAQTMNSRLTHLVLAHNKLAGLTPILAAIATNCPNLQLLDLSNIRTYATNTALLHVEKLQGGCSKLRVLRITNSQIWLAPVSLSDQVASPGFPNLEELSLAGLEDAQITARSIDDNGIERILKSSTKLRLLDVRGCIRLSDSGLVRVPAWDLEHLFLSGCNVTRQQYSGMELILQKWSHSLLEVDLAWSTATSSLDAAVLTLAEKGAESPLQTLNLCGSSVSLEPVKAVLMKCPKLNSINLQSCRALPRGIKRLYYGSAVAELRQSLQNKPKTENSESDAEQTPTSDQVTE